MEKYHDDAGIPKPPIGELHVQPPEGRPEFGKGPSPDYSARKDEKKEVMQISPESGVFKDYINEFVVPDICLKDVLSKEYDLNNDDDVVDLKFAAAQLNERFVSSHLRKYEERYPANKYGDVKTEKNIPVIQELNEKVEELNQLMLKNWTSDDLVSPQEKDRLIKANVLCGEIMSLIKVGKRELVEAD